MLQEFLQKKIERFGALPLSDYMALCLYHPEHGYYSQNVLLGKDFTTSPEVSQMFGEMVGLWCLHTWQQMGEPDAIDLVELGPGRGIMMADILRVAQTQPAFYKALHVAMIEMSPVLKATQQKQLSSHRNCRWYGTLDQLGSRSKIFVGNEFFDAFPVKQFQKLQSGWYEQLVHYDAEKKIFGQVLDRMLSQLSPILDTMVTAQVGQVFEMPTGALHVYTEILRTLKVCGGAALFFDYGFNELQLGSTLQAMHQGQVVNVFDNPGQNDLTTYVQFKVLQGEANKAGLEASQIITQASWLQAMGIGLRAEILSKKSAQQSIIQDCNRLVDPQGMGAFKVMAVGQNASLITLGFTE